MSNPIARDKNEFQVLSQCSVAGKILFEPKKGRKFALRFANIWYEYGGEKVAETTTDKEGKFIFKRVPGLNGGIFYSMQCILPEEKFDLRQMGDKGEYAARFPEQKGQGIDSTGQKPTDLEIMITDPEWIPDLMMREFVISGLKGISPLTAPEKLWNVFKGEIDQELKAMSSELSLLQKNRGTR